MTSLYWIRAQGATIRYPHIPKKYIHGLVQNYKYLQCVSNGDTTVLHCGLLMVNGVTGIYQHCFMYWLVIWWYQAITWTNDNLPSNRPIRHLGTYFNEILLKIQISFQGNSIWKCLHFIQPSKCSHWLGSRDSMLYAFTRLVVGWW